MAEAIYLLCALTSLLCAVLLLRGYGRSKVPLLLWSGLCFVGLFVNNALVFIDLIVLPSVDLLLARDISALVSIFLLLYGLVVDAPQR